MATPHTVLDSLPPAAPDRTIVTMSCSLPLLALTLCAATPAVPAAPPLDLDAATRPVPDPAGALLAQGVSRARAGDHAGAVAVLAAAAIDLGELADYALVHGAESALADGRPDVAVALLEDLRGGTPLDDRARGLQGRGLAASGRPTEALPLLQRYLADYPNGSQAPQVREALAAALDVLGRKGEAAAERRRLWALHPRALPAMPAPAAPTPEEILSRARDLSRAHRHKEVVGALAPLAKLKLSPELACRTRFLTGHTRFKQRKHKAAAAELGAYVKSGCADDRVRALYLLGRARSRSRDNTGAVAAFDQLVAEFPGRSHADDALLLKAETLVDLKRPDKAEKTLREQVARYPDGDMVEEARWRLAWLPYRRGRLKAALKALDDALRSGHREEHYYTRGRTFYWKGRVHARLGAQKAALAAWRRCAREYPLSYYALQALNRLQEVGATVGPDLLPPAGGPTEWRFAHRPAFDDPGFARALRLLRVGLPKLAKGELSALGLLAGDDSDGRWLAAVLFERVGMFPHSHSIPRRQLPGYQDRPPTGEAYREWLLAYPRPFEPEVRAAAAEGGVPKDLLWALVREESGFNPEIESWANAIGLAQLLLRTARGVAKGLPGVQVDARTLRDPALNLRLGARYLGGLHGRFSHHALAVAGYNAGGAAVARWRKRFGGLSADELVEAIPYEQTRNYTKRVLMAWGRYHFLYGKGDVVALPLPVP